ncbi:tRNA 2-selenouridine(34) synthase MnmH [Caloranaerobacter ferrireducens]|uniref:tRNA 2-selenouridine(34) synthase MnmH n=1 Tax=Caloranaerobacter ferrireducens TaxID=1323370 RepID=UPI00084DF2BD|nr:tRNA 2-selenouridine(34) synthase MnmH [Caloranaerobacter ferrireducens]
MINVVKIEDVIDKDDIVYIDVRSPSEYKIDTIPEAINMPILTDKEREEIGYIYKQVDVEKAKVLGLEYASKKLVDFYSIANKIKREGKKIALFCYRGGMRSNSVAKVLDAMGLDVFLIEGGYKSYRHYVLKTLQSYKNKIKFIVLHGYTGTGKTKLLSLLEKQGEPVLNLEYLARNSGSVFGNIYFREESSTQKKFDSMLLKKLKEVKNSYMFVESESKRIGRIVIQDFLYNDISNGYHILIKTSLDNRVKNIIDEYVNIQNYNEELIIDSINKLKKRLGHNKVEELVKQVKIRNFDYVIKELMIEYYDPLYKYSIDKIKHFDKIIEYRNISEAVNELIDFVENTVLKGEPR